MLFIIKQLTVRGGYNGLVCRWESNPHLAHRGWKDDISGPPAARISDGGFRLLPERLDKTCTRTRVRKERPGTGPSLR